MIMLAVTVVGCGDDDPPDDVTGPAPGPPTLQIRQVSPNSGNAALSTTIFITGAGFQTGTTLTIGGIPVPLSVTDPLNARAAAPPHAPGAVDLVMTNPNGERAQLTGGFRYVELPIRVEISGNSALQSIGETSQLTATATFADGSILDVTRQAQWTVQFPAVAAIGSDGMLVGRALGLTTISARYPITTPSVFGTGSVTVTPPGTFALSGRVREPGSGSISAASVVHVESGQSVQTSTFGDFVMGGLAGRLRLRVTKTGYEDSDAEATANEFLDIPLQRPVHVQAGAAAYSSRLAPNDVEHRADAATLCQPCRLIRVTTATPGPASITLRWTGSPTLQVWVNGRSFQAASGDREITADAELGIGDTIVFIGRLRSDTIENYIPFNVVVRH